MFDDKQPKARNRGSLLMTLNAKGRHNRDRFETKASDGFFEEIWCYPGIADTIVRLRPRRVCDMDCESIFLENV